MANSAQHREKVDRNHAFLMTLVGKPDFPEWKAVCAFYTAVHSIERLRASFNEHSQNHDERFAFFRIHKKPFSSIYHNYRILYDASILARYQTRSQFDKAFSDAVVESELIGKHLKAIIDFVNKFYATSTMPPTVAAPQPPPATPTAGS
jgi:hypothetical protein